METVKEDTAIARAKKGDTATTVQLFASTRDRLKALKSEFFGEESASFDELLNKLVDQATGEGDDLDEDLAADLTARIEQLENVMGMLCEDPQNGYLFRADSDRVERGIEGTAGEGEVQSGIFAPTRTQYGAWVKAPGSERRVLSERDGTLPAKVLEFVKAEELEHQKAKALVEKKAKK